MDPPATRHVAVEARSVTKTFVGDDDDVTALDDVGVSIGENEFFTLLGPSGCSKTTLLRLVAGFDHPTCGEIRLHGEDIPPAALPAPGQHRVPELCPLSAREDFHTDVHWNGAAFARDANGIKGAEEFMPTDMKTATEVNIPAEFAAKGSIAEKGGMSKGGRFR